MNYSLKHAAHENPASRVRNVALHERCGVADGIMLDVIFKLRVNQLTTTMRMQGLDAESGNMLYMLESLVIAGEIPFADFMQRVQNLFPHLFDRIDARLRDNLLRMLSDDM